jgi:hypothetical protein
MSVTREYQAAGKKRVNHIVARWIEGEAFDVGQPGQVRSGSTVRARRDPARSMCC